ncbi:MAG: hypothetical protein RMJ98_19795 [Myxococcales bacterium]|nr:hypothetical protein [Polyangiaceae bacterium]MDW8251544.1 hypothetical protein [Myxococcales bacterium]
MMVPSVSDRRQRRSNDPITALHYQLAHTRYHGGFDALVLVDQAGALVAGAGAWPLCEELAAFAPLLSDEPSRPQGEPSEILRLRPYVQLQTLRFQGVTVLLAARSMAPEAVEGHLAIAAAGCLRILASASSLAA